MKAVNRNFRSVVAVACLFMVSNLYGKDSKTRTAASSLSLQTLQDEISRLQSEVETLKSSQKVMAGQNALVTTNRTFFNTGIELFIPHQRTFTSEVDTGLGAFVGLGQYFGEHHVAALSFEWDLYPAFSLRYRYEFHFSNPSLAFGPTVGYKVRLANLNPWDNFISNPSDLKNSYFFAGAMAGFPMQNSMATLELLYLTNQQTFILLNVGIQFFFSG